MKTKQVNKGITIDKNRRLWGIYDKAARKLVDFWHCFYILYMFFSILNSKYLSNRMIAAHVDLKIKNNMNDRGRWSQNSKMGIFTTAKSRKKLQI